MSINSSKQTYQQSARSHKQKSWHPQATWSPQAAPNKPGKSTKGFTLIEILVALVVLSIGLLGIASMQVQGLRNNQSAYLRSQATMLAYDIADRMRTNMDRAIAGDYDGFDTSSTLPSAPSCISSASGCSPSSLSTNDMVEWANMIKGTGSSIVLLPDAQGTITRGANNLFTITVNWKETQYDDQTQAKTVSTQSFLTNFSL